MAAFEKGKYTESKDKKKDEKMMDKAGLNKEERKKFEKADKAHAAKKKPETMQEDKKIDTKNIEKIQKAEKETKGKKKKK